MRSFYLTASPLLIVLSSSCIRASDVVGQDSEASSSTSTTDPTTGPPDPICGDGIHDIPTEECEDGNNTPGDGCDGTCHLECGNGRPDDGEGCDDSNTNDFDSCPSGAIGKCFAFAVCGDGLVWDGIEQCDDGNLMDGDLCEADCTLPQPECGNGFLESGEACDDGNNMPNDGCEPDCSLTPAADCGNGRVEIGEVCDDGNFVDEDECPSGLVGNCKKNAECGDGILWVDSEEECDDGNDIDTDACVPECLLAKCGDGFVGPGEFCDDKYELGGGCADDCKAEERLVFVTSDVFTGNMNKSDGEDKSGLSLADKRCTDIANNAGLDGPYIAWLSDDMSPAEMRFDKMFTGVYRLRPNAMSNPQDNTIVAAGWNGLIMGLSHPININESGTLTEVNVWTGTTPSGMATPPVDMKDQNCGSWTSTDFADDGAFGVSSQTNDQWTEANESACNAESALYCFQQ
jgi:cysteine-rich repeat protein